MGNRDQCKEIRAFVIMYRYLYSATFANSSCVHHARLDLSCSPPDHLVRLAAIAQADHFILYGVVCSPKIEIRGDATRDEGKERENEGGQEQGVYRVVVR
jgi:hypothetical protein